MPTLFVGYGGAARRPVEVAAAAAELLEAPPAFMNTIGF